MSIFTVANLNRYLAVQLKQDKRLQGIFVRGEIADFHCHPRSGHCYFTLRDETSAMKAVMFASAAERLRFMPHSGMTVIAAGSITVYERDGVYQLYVTDLQPDGVGAAHLALKQRKEKLAALGYFDEARKRPLPPFPKKIGVVTAPGGAALQDILHILSRRYPVGTVQLFPVLVQGADAPKSISSAIDRASVSDCDVLIVGRGGGSNEDLSAFDEECVATSIFRCQIPVISAVGHETDVSIADYTADLRASTPSAAAELAAPELSVMLASLAGMEHRMREGMQRRLESLELSLTEKHAALERCSVTGRLERMEERMTQLSARLRTAMTTQLARHEQAFSQQVARLDCLSPLKVMLRGYALVYSGEEILTSVQDVRQDDKLTIRLSDGEIAAAVTDVRRSEE